MSHLWHFIAFVDIDSCSSGLVENDISAVFIFARCYSFRAMGHPQFPAIELRGGANLPIETPERRHRQRNGQVLSTQHIQNLGWTANWGPHACHRGHAERGREVRCKGVCIRELSCSLNDSMYINYDVAGLRSSGRPSPEHVHVVCQCPTLSIMFQKD